jgi:thymidylate kinase
MGKIVVFDQAFVQAVCSLALFCGVADEALISYALDFVPKPDLLVRLDAPIEVLEERLRDRHHLGGKIERLLEQDMEISLNSRNVVDLLHELLSRSGWSVVSMTSLDQGSLETAVEQIELQIASIAEQNKPGMTTSAHVETAILAPERPLS